MDDKTFKAGIGDGEDLMPLTKYNNNLENYFTAGVGLTARKLTEIPNYLTARVNFSLIPHIIQRIPNHQPADYEIDIAAYPNYIARYYLSIVGPDNMSVNSEDNYEMLEYEDNKLKDASEEICEEFYNNIFPDEEYEDLTQEDRSKWIDWIREKNTRYPKEGYMEDTVTPFRTYSFDYKDYEGIFNDGDDIEQGNTYGQNAKNTKTTLKLANESFLELPEKTKFTYTAYPRIPFCFQIKNKYHMPAGYDYAGNGYSHNTGLDAYLDISPEKDTCEGYSTISTMDQIESLSNPGNNINYLNLDKPHYEYGIRQIADELHTKMMTRLWKADIYMGDWQDETNDDDFSWPSSSAWSSGNNDGINLSTSSHSLIIDTSLLFPDIVNNETLLPNEETRMFIPFPRGYNEGEISGPPYRVRTLETEEDSDGNIIKQRKTIRSVHTAEAIEEFGGQNFPIITGSGLVKTGISSGITGYGMYKFATSGPAGWAAAAVVAIGALLYSIFRSRPEPVLALEIEIECSRSEIELSNIEVLPGLDVEVIDPNEDFSNNVNQLKLAFGKDLKRDPSFDVLDCDDYDLFALTNYKQQDILTNQDFNKEYKTSFIDLNNWSGDPIANVPGINAFDIRKDFKKYPEEVQIELN